jgi:hypothetical protein
MKETRDNLVTILAALADEGRLADVSLVEAETAQAVAPSRDEQSVQTLGALSREIWAAHKATLAAIAATHQLEGLERR